MPSEKDDKRELNLDLLRARALSRLSSATIAPDSQRTPEELLHELQVYQIELEMQNEELRRANAALEESRERYAELYEFPPTGYLTLDAQTGIFEASLNGAGLLGVDRGSLLGKRFDAFVVPSEIERWRRQFARVLQEGGKHVLEFSLCRGDRLQFQARLNCVRVDGPNGEPRVRLALTDTTDIGELRRLVAETRLPAVVFESQQGMAITDGNGVILRVNGGFSAISGYTEHDVVGRTMNLLRSGRHDSAFYAAIWDEIRKSGTWHGEVWSRRRNGQTFPSFITITAVAGADGVVTHYVGTMVDITQRKAAEDAIQRLAFFDPLTRLPNRRLLLDRLRRALAAGTRTQRIGALLFIDLDDFKILNDTHGHDIGDLFLLQVAERLGGCVREGDTVARLGGDEFVVVLENLSVDAEESATQVKRVGEKMRVALNQPYRIGVYEIVSSASIGVTLFNNHQCSVSELMKRADLAMYEAKAAGRNALRFFDPEMQAAVVARAALEADFCEALARREFVLHFQPQVGGDGGVRGFEALVRWRYPKRGLLPPSEFIPLAEKSGLILALGLWVLEGVCDQLVKWSADPETAGFRISVNVSARQIHEPDFVDRVLEVIERSGADPHKLLLELPESVLRDDVESTVEKMHALKNRGVAFSMDNFGTGYSCLAFLKRLPLDQLKIDRSFIRNLLNDPNAATIATMVVALAQSMNIAVMAEGVETQDQRDFLAGHGCGDYQGYLYSPPLPIRALKRMLGDGGAHVRRP